MTATFAVLGLLATLPQEPPRLDLATETTRQVVVDRQEGQYLGHVSTILLEDGHTILAAYPQGHGRGAIVMKRSADGGRTWSERLPVPPSFATSREVPTLHRVTDPAGKRRLILWSGLHPARFSLSDDDGATWSELRPAGDWGGIVVMGDLLAQRTPGHHFALFHDDGRFLAAGGKATGTFTLLQTGTTDGGRTWSAPRAIWQGSDVHLCEPGLLRSPDGGTIAMLLRENARRQPSHVMFSVDDGASWSQPRPTHPSRTGDRHTLRHAKDGRVVAVFRAMPLDDADPWKGDFVAWVGTWDDLQHDRPGQHLVRLLDNRNRWDCGYPGLEVLPDGTLVATTYGHWQEGQPPYIVSVRFTLAELDARATPPPSAPRAAGNRQQDLAAALAALESYRPTRAIPDDPAITAAVQRLQRAMPALARGDSPVARRLAELLQQRRDVLLPSPKNRIHARDPLARMLVLFDDERTLNALLDGLVAHPSAVTFPGAVAPDAARIERTVTVDLAVPGRHGLGLYAPPGAVLTCRFTGPDGAPIAPTGLQLRVGAHSDNVRRRDDWQRMPRISRTFEVTAAETRAGSAFGGLLYVEVSKAAPASTKVRVTVTGAVAAPRFVLGATDPVDWRAQLAAAPGPWAELETAKVALTVPTAVVRNLDDPTAVLQFWDRVADGAADLAARPHQRLRAERYVADVQISAGYMHAGYPIMIPLKEAATVVSLERMRQAPWGLFHEFGHNHQEKDWTFAGTGEVTVNLFSLYLCETLCGVGWQQAWGGNLVKAEARLAEHLREGTRPWGSDEGKADLGLRLVMYRQLQGAFGWDAFRKCFAEYEALPAADRPKDDAQKRDQWLLRFSRTVGRDLGPFFEAWGLPTSAEARASLRDLPEWMPADWPAGR